MKLVGLAESPDEYLKKGFTPEKQARSFASIARDHGMPIDSSVRPRMAATMPACRAVVAARLHAPEAERALLRRLRIRHFSGELLDEPKTIHGAARDAGIDPADLDRWTAEPAVRGGVARGHGRRPPPDERGARPRRQARQLVGRPALHVPVLRDRPHRRRQRASRCPASSPSRSTTSSTANLVPGVDRREPPDDVAEVLRWAGTPLASKEVAVVCDISVQDAREALGRVADEQHVGFDGFWSLNGAR